MECSGSKVTGQFEALKLLVSERLSEIATEIVSAIAKTFIEYEAQAVRLKEENARHRSLLDVFVNSRLQPKTPVSQVAISAPASSNVPSDNNGPATASCAKKTSPVRLRISPDPHGKFVFTSCDDFLAHGMNRECRYCVKPCEATETHLKQKHYKEAAHFVLNGTRHFVVSCTCKERVQASRRSHFHCAFCHKILSRKLCFGSHVLKMHGIALVKNPKEAELSPSSFETDDPPLEEQAPLSSDSWCREAGSLDQEIQQAALFLQMNDERRQQKKHAAQIQARAGRSDASTQLDQETGSAEAESPRSESRRRRSSPTAVKLLPTSSASLRPSGGTYRCKACGKTFHYTYTLRAHVQAHRLEGVCGICGRRLGRGEALLQHLQSHRRRKKCGVCGKQFSDEARLRRHSAFHRPRALSAAPALG